MNILFIISFWRAVLFGISVITQYTTSFAPRFPYSDVYLIPSDLPQWVWGWANFDGVHYITIAQRGYFANFTQAFFPLYPILLKVFSIILHDRYLIISGILFSFITFYIGVKLFSQLLRFDYLPRQVSLVILSLLIFPTSFYFGALYTEPLFLMYVLAAFLAARKKRWILAALFGLMASATRVTGVLLMPALLWEWFITVKHTRPIVMFKKNKFQLNVFLNIIREYFVSVIKSPITYIVPIGLFLYMFYLQLKFSDWLYFWHVQPAFGAERSLGVILPPQVVWRYIKILRDVEFLSIAFLSAFLEISSYVFVVILLFVGHLKKIRFSYLLFSWLVILVPTFTGTFSSMPRYILLAFPIYIVIGTITNVYLRTLIYGISIVLLILLTQTFIQGGWVA